MLDGAKRWTRRLRCPRCHGEFDYDLVPVMSVTAIRLGTSRYMRCPLCHRWGMFPLTRSKGDGGGAVSGPTPILPSESGTGGTGEGPLTGRAVPRFNDRRPLARWGVLLIVPAVVLMLFGVLLQVPTNTELLLVVAGALVLCAGAALLIGFSLPDRVR